ncbi:MAG TPA: tetratricopeptide repeat protein [Bryobacteraceae bacterium]|nr:tetratricopeptide repeat protein [Bryobacteraceae bacterium]
MALRLLLVFLLLAVPLELPGCGPFLPEALFTLKLQPERPDTEFARGQLGVISPTYKRFFLTIAYRYLSGAGLNDAERAALFPPPANTAEEPPVAKPWLDARNAVAGIKPVSDVNAYRRGFQPDSYDYFLNCGADAFRAAAGTLSQRMQQFGASSPLIADWIAAQDAVFDACSADKPTLPAPASDPKLRADRAYQIAAAKFYSGQYDAAHADFEQIASDAKSPWHASAPYLQARCSTRKGDYKQAAAELRKVAADPSRLHWHEPAQRLLQYVQTATDPASRIRQLGQMLVKPGIQDHIAQDLDDYRLLLDRVDKPPREDDLTDWIKSYQEGERDHIFEMWHQQKSLPWLIAALQQTKPGDTEAPGLLKAAAAIQTDSPGYMTVAWHMLRLMPAGDVRATVDEVLKLRMPAGARNLFRGRRLEQARNFQEFLEYAPRTVVGDEADVEEVDPKTDQLLDDDSQKVLDRMPLPLLKQASTSSLLPPKVRQQLANVVWLRSFLLEPSPSFDDLYKLLKTPGYRFRVDSGFGRYTDDPAVIDNFRDNWWCAVNREPPEGVPPEKPEPPPAPPAFLTAAEVAQGKSDWDRLAALPAGADWLSAQVLGWAQKTPTDPRIPEALYLAVRSTRYGCTDKDTGTFSKRAFDLLHSKYPNTNWAAQTKYWYK